MAVAAFAGGAYAAGQESGASVRQAFLSDVAKRLHVTPQQLSAALKGAALDQLHAAVAAGRLTQAQADAMAQRIKKGDVAPAGGFWFFEGPGGPAGRGFGFFGGPGRPAGRGFGFGAPGGPAAPGLRGQVGPAFGLHGPLEAAAGYLGLTPVQLLEQLRSGKSMAQVAKSRGKSVSGLQNAIKTAVKERLDKAVAAKWLSAAQEQKLITRLSAKLAAVINLKWSAPRFAFRAPGKLIPHGSWRSGPGGSSKGPAGWAPGPPVGTPD